MQVVTDVYNSHLCQLRVEIGRSNFFVVTDPVLMSASGRSLSNVLRNLSGLLVLNLLGSFF